MQLKPGLIGFKEERSGRSNMASSAFLGAQVTTEHHSRKLNPWFPQYGPHTSSIHLTWEVVTSACTGLPQTAWISLSGLGVWGSGPSSTSV